MKELEKIAPKLSKIKKENPFGVPPYYFDDFSFRLQMKIETEEMTLPTGYKNRFIQFLKPALSLAASFALVFLVAYFSLNTNNKNELFADDASQSIELTDDNYISLLEGLDDDSFYAFISEPFTDDDYSDEELLAYLSFNMSDYDIYMEIDF